MGTEWAAVGEYPDPDDAEWVRSRLGLEEIGAEVREGDDGLFAVWVAAGEADRVRAVLAADVRPATDDDGPTTLDADEDEPPPNPAVAERLRLSEQAFYLGIFAFAFPPAALVGAWKAVKAVGTTGEIGFAGWIGLGAAVALVLLSLGFWAVVFASAFST